MDRMEKDDDVELNLSQLVSVPLKHKKLIGGITAATAVVSLVWSLLMTPIFRAETKILPPRQETSSNIAMQLLNQVGGLAGLAAGTVGMKNDNELYIGILRSRTVLDRIIDQFGLMKLYDAKYRMDARRELADALQTTNGKDGMIAVAVEDPDPKRAADMANAFVDGLIHVTKGLAITEAAQRRLFFEQQLKDVNVELAKAEEDIEKFQEKTGALKIDDQARAVIQSIGSLRAQIAAKEVEYKVAQTFATSQNPDLQRLEEELAGLRSELGKLETKGKGTGPDPLIPTGRMPSVGMQFVRKLRDVRYYETLYELLSKQYELAKLDEARNAVVIQVVDKAIPPERKARPKRALIVSLSTFGSLLFSVCLAFAVERRRNV